MAVDIQPSNAPAPDPAATPDVSGNPAGMPTDASSTIGATSQPQPAAPPKESLMQGIRRGASGEKYVVDAAGNVQSARTTAPSAKGEFGSILGGIVFGALQGATRARPGGIPSHEIGGGFGAGVGAAEEAANQRDLRNRGQAQQQFQNQQEVQKQSREQLESKAQIAHLNLDSERIRQATQYADEEHPLIMKAKELGLTEQAQGIQKMSSDIQKSAFEMMETAAKYGIDPSVMLTSFADAHQHAGDIGSGRSAALYNGVPSGEEGHGSGIFDPRQLRNTPLLKPETFSTWTADKDGKAVEHVNTMHAGTSALEYMSNKIMRTLQLEKIQSQQKIKLAADLTKADIREKNASANQKNAEAKKAQTETTQIANLNPKGSEGLSGDAYLKTLPQPTQQLFQSVAEGRNTAFTLQNRKGELTPAGEAFIRAYPDFDVAKSKEYPKLVAEFTTGQTGKSLVSQGTAINHARAAYDNTGASSFIPGTAENKRYNADVTYVSEELGKYLKAGVATKEEVHAIQDSLQSHIPWIRKPALENAAKIIEGRRSELQQQWKNGQVRPSYQPPMPNISPEAEANLAYLRSGGRAQQPAQQAQPQGQQTQQKPTQQVFNPVAWQAAHPGQDVNAAIAYAKSQGIQVKQ